MSRPGFLGGLLVGAGIGIVTGILLAFRKGSSPRVKLARKVTAKKKDMTLHKREVATSKKNRKPKVKKKAST